MNDALPMPRKISKENARRYQLSWRFQLFLVRTACVVVATVGFVAGFALAESQSTPESSPQLQAVQSPMPSQSQAKLQDRGAAVPSVANRARIDKAAANAAEPEIVAEK